MINWQKINLSNFEKLQLWNLTLTQISILSTCQVSFSHKRKSERIERKWETNNPDLYHLMDPEIDLPSTEILYHIWNKTKKCCSTFRGKKLLRDIEIWQKKTLCCVYYFARGLNFYSRNRKRNRMKLKSRNLVKLSRCKKSDSNIWWIQKLTWPDTIPHLKYKQILVAVHNEEKTTLIN